MKGGSKSIPIIDLYNQLYSDNKKDDVKPKSIKKQDNDKSDLISLNRLSLIK